MNDQALHDYYDTHDGEPPCETVLSIALWALAFVLVLAGVVFGIIPGSVRG